MPRFVLVEGGPRLSRPSAWPGPAHELRDPAAPVVVGTWFSWRLLGRNNRELGRSPRRFATVEDVASDVAGIVRRLRAGRAEPAVVRASDVGWTWRWVDAGAIVAVGARGYLRRRDADASAAQFAHDGAEADLVASSGAGATAPGRPDTEATA